MDDDRPSAIERGYGAAWKKIRDKYIEAHPYCEHVECAGRQVKDRNEVDHITPRVNGGGDEPENLQTLCKHHHSRKTRLQNPLIRG